MFILSCPLSFSCSWYKSRLDNVDKSRVEVSTNTGGPHDGSRPHHGMNIGKPPESHISHGCQGHHPILYPHHFGEGDQQLPSTSFFRALIFSQLCLWSSKSPRHCSSSEIVPNTVAFLVAPRNCLPNLRELNVMGVIIVCMRSVSLLFMCMCMYVRTLLYVYGVLCVPYVCAYMHKHVYLTG